METSALSSKGLAQNIELEKLRAEVTDLLGLKEKLAKCKDLSEHLAMADIWRGRIKEYLDLAGQTLDQAADQSLKICQEVARMLKVQDKFVADNEHVIKLFLEDMDRFEKGLDAAKVYKLRSKRHSWIARQWLGSDATVPFMRNLSTEMIGVDFDKLLELSVSSL